jgi:hypothetical protein
VELALSSCYCQWSWECFCTPYCQACLLRCGLTNNEWCHNKGLSPNQVSWWIILPLRTIQWSSGLHYNSSHPVQLSMNNMVYL